MVVIIMRVFYFPSGGNSNALTSSLDRKKQQPRTKRNETKRIIRRVFLSLALFQLSRPLESEESYKKAIEVSPGQALARQGLCSLYEKTGRWNDCCGGLEEVMRVFAAR